METKKGAYKLLVLSSLIVIILTISLSSGGFFSWFKNITGQATTQTVIVNITIGAGTAPTIIYIFNASLAGGISLNEGPSNTNITINFTANDSDGAANLNDTSARINITKSGESVARFNSTCSKIATAGAAVNYSCIVPLAWFDIDGIWVINATISDLSGNNASNSSASLTINTLSAFVSGPASMTFATISAGATNQTSDNDPIRLNNTGNQYIYRGKIDINATSLRGETDNSKYLYVGNFSVSNDTGSSRECDILSGTAGGSAVNLTNTSGSSFTPINGTIINAALQRGNFTVNDGTAQEDLYVCLRTAGSELSQQSYSTSSLGAWTVRVTTGQ